MPIATCDRPVSLEDELSKRAFRLCDEALQSVNGLYVSKQDRFKQARQRLTKQADFGENQNPQFEQAFGSIAFTYLREKAPGLVENVLGFQLLERGDDGRQGIGAFVAKVGDKIIDIPMFFVNGELKGHHVMRVRSPEMFVPLREGFLDYLVSKMPQDMGTVGPGLNSTDVSRNGPDISPFSGNRYLKSAAERDFPWVRSFAKDSEMVGSYVQMRTDPETLRLGIALKNKEAGTHFDLKKALRRSLSMTKTAVKLCDEYPLFRDKLAKLMGDDWLTDVAQSHRPKATNHLHLLKNASQRISRFVSQPIEMPELQLIDGKKMASTWSENQTAFSDKLRDKYAEEINRWDDVVIDNRGQDKLAVSYKIEDGKVCVHPPTEAGQYDVMMADGNTKTCFVIPSSYRPHHALDLILDVSGKKFVQCDRNHYIAQVRNAADDARNGSIDKLVSGTRKRPKEGELFFVATSKDSVYGPFVVERQVTSDRYEVHDLGNSLRHDRHSSGFLGNDTKVRCKTVNRDIEEIMFTSSKDESDIGGPSDPVLVVGKDKKVFVLGKTDRKDSEDYWYPSRKFRDSFGLDIRDAMDVGVTQLTRKSNLKVSKLAHGRFEINGVQLRAKDARRNLVGGMSLSKQAAEEILADAGSLPTSYLVTSPGQKIMSLNQLDKLAYIAPQVPFPDTADPYASETGRYTISEPDTQSEEAEQALTREPLGPFDEPEPVGIDAQQEGLSGDQLGAMQQDEGDILTDMAGLEAILRNSRIDASVKALSRSLLQAIDKLGRQIFIFHAHREEFADMYGDEELDDLESSMVTTFESAGDLFLAIARKTVDAHPELDIADMPEAV